MKIFSSLRQNKIAFTLSTMVAVFLVASLVSAATTISTNISTAGNIETTAGTLTVGSGGTAIGVILKGHCGTLIGADISHAASSTKPYDCNISGVVSGDTVIAQLSTSTPMTLSSSYWSIVGAKASTTANYITVLLYNNGPATVPSALGVGSSTSYIIMH